MSDAKDLMKQLTQVSNKARLTRRKEDFCEMMERYMKARKHSSRTLAQVSGISDRTIRRMKGDDTYEPTREMIIAVCVGMKLTLDESLDLIEKSQFRLRADSPIDAIYLEILENEGEYSVEEWNVALDMMGAKPIGGGR